MSRRASMSGTVSGALASVLVSAVGHRSAWQGAGSLNRRKACLQTAQYVLILCLVVCPADGRAVSEAVANAESFRVMLQLPPSQYAAERGRLLAQGYSALVLLKEKQRFGVSWYERAIAAALVLRIESPEECHQYEKFVRDDWGLTFTLGDWSGEWFVRGTAQQATDAQLVNEQKGVVPFLIERLFNEPQRKISDGSVIGFHTRLPQRGAQLAHKQVGGKDAARAIAVAVIAGDRSSPQVWEASLLSDDELVARLIPLLHGETQPRAAWALGELQDPAAIQPLINSLSNQNNAVAGTATDALAKIGAPAIPALRATLVGPASTMQQFAIQTGVADALAKMGTRAIPVLGEALEAGVKGPPNNQDAVVRALRAIGGHEVVPVLIQALKTTDKQARSDAAYALGEIGGDEARSALLDAFAVPENHSQLPLFGIAHGLGVLRETRALEGLCELTTNADWLVRRAAIDGLERIRSRRAVPVIVRCLSSASSSTRGDAALALGYLGDPSATEHLVARLSDSEHFVSSWSQWALKAIKERELIESRIAALRDAAQGVRQSAGEWLRATTGQKLEASESAWLQWWDKNDYAYLIGARPEQPAQRGPAAGEKGTTHNELKPQ